MSATEAKVSEAIASASEAVSMVCDQLDGLARDKPTLAKLLLYRFAKACGVHVCEGDHVRRADVAAWLMKRSEQTRHVTADLALAAAATDLENGEAMLRDGDA
jgi:hypothetical protein